ncbi:hypothetical protein QUF79_01590 [Fictibacillus enclensis]|uniref:hypothetical protein n=1 Tax=Fictibacillus enclensis TaxID=1017270 RepID=UPI0025A1F94F|nr:hypothetical protein [Fictibacillus enclensis]MDM5196777.1 hypothetical protein [Fictibacillus enclensis]
MSIKNFKNIKVQINHLENINLSDLIKKFVSSPLFVISIEYWQLKLIDSSPLTISPSSAYRTSQLVKKLCQVLSLTASFPPTFIIKLLKKKERFLILPSLAHVEMYSPKPYETLWFFKELLGMEESHREGQSVYLRAYEDFYHHTLKITKGEEPGLGHVAWRATCRL